MDRAARDKLSRELGLLGFRSEGERRPVLLDQVLLAGLRTLRPSLEPDAYLRLRGEVVSLVAEMLEHVRSEPVAEIRAPESDTLTEVDAQRMRALHIYGLSTRDIAGLFETDKETTRRVLRRPASPAAPPSRRKGRALDLT